MKKSFIFKSILILTLVIFVLPLSAKAIPSEIGYKWENKSPLIDRISYPTGASEAICQSLFAADDTNIFKEVICSFTRLAALSVSNLVTEITCTVQQVGNNNNYRSSSGGTVVSFNSTSGRCKESPTDPLGSKTLKTGFYSGSFTDSASQLTQSLAPPTGTATASSTYEAFSIARNIMGLLALVGLFVFAFANILHIEVNTYAIKKAIPTAIIAIIGGWVSIYVVFLLSRFVDFTFQLNLFSPYQAYHPMQNIFGGYLGVSSTASGTLKDDSVRLIFDIGASLIGSNKVSFFSGILGSIMLIIPALAAFAFEYILSLRAFAVQILAVIAPVAFACLVLPQTQTLFRKWWTYLLIALFFAPLANLTFYVLSLFGNPGDNITVFMALWLLKTAALVFLIRLPFTIEADIKKITAALARTSFGSALGLSRFATEAKPQDRTAAGNKPVTLANAKDFLSGGASKVVAPASPASQGKPATPFSNIRPRIKPTDQISGLTPSIKVAIKNAIKENTNRTPDLIVKSSTNIEPNTFRAVVDQSDLKLWRDTRLIEQLKNQDGQILDDQGAAIRTDSARRMMRLAQVVQDGKIANPQILKTLATKGVLDSLPIGLVKESIDEGILQKNDLVPTFKQNTDRVLDHITKSQPGQFGVTEAQAKTLIVKDQKDYESGFRDLAKLFADTIRDPSIFPPPSPSVLKNIVGQMRSLDSDIFEKNGRHYLSRLAEIKKSSVKEITGALSQAKVPSQTALAIAKNPRLDFSDAKKYMSKDRLNGENLTLLREGFLNRDMANDMVGSISGLMKEQKQLIGKGITQKLTENISKSGEDLKLNQVKDSMLQIVSKLSTGVTPEEADKISKDVDKFYPGATLKAGLVSGNEDTEKTTEKTKSIIETIEAMIQNGITEDVLKNDPQKAQAAVGQDVQKKIEAAVDDQTAKDGKFDKKLDEITKKPKSE